MSDKNASKRWGWFRELVYEWLGVWGPVYKRLRVWFYKRFGKWGGAAFVLLAVLFIGWTQWSYIMGLPGISSVVELIHCNALPQADPHRFSVAVAHLEDDDADRSHEKLIADLLNKFEGVQVLAFNCTIPVHGSVLAEQERKGHETARQYLEASNASVLIWGRVLRHGDQSKPSLYLTAAAGQDGRSRQYTPETGEEFSLPDVFWDDLADVLRLVIATEAAQFEEGHYVADRLRRFIDQVRTLLYASAGRPGWNARQRASTQYLLANALLTYGEQSGQAKVLKEAIITYEQALDEWEDERVPFEWDTVHYILGTARLSLGIREGGTARLTEALETFETVLELWPRERVPLQWAGAQNDRGVALLWLGIRDGGTARLEAAVAAFREAQKEYPRERVPLLWAMTQNNIGLTLVMLGEHENDTARLEQALESVEAVLELLRPDRELVPLEWALTQNNRGLALLKLGERESGTARLEAAVAAFREAQKEIYPREQVPLLWAMTQNNLSLALSILGQRENDTARLEEAVAAYRAALVEYTRERVPLDWAMAQNNLSETLAALGKRESGTARLEEAVEACRAALEEWTRERVPLQWAEAQNNLGTALFSLGTRTRDRAKLEEARNAIKGALEVYLHAGQEHRREEFEDRLRAIDEELERLPPSPQPISTGAWHR